MKQKKVREEGEHETTINVTIAKASILKPDGDVDSKKGDLPQVQNYFHCQYKLLPDDREFVKTDVVTFGTAAKVYGDNDSKVLRTWLDGDKTWITWTTSRIVRVTQDVLLKMFKHKFELKMWDTKDKVSAKARFDRPKAFRLPQSKAVEEMDLDTIRKMLQHDGKRNIFLGTGLSSLLPNEKSTTEREVKIAQKKVSFVNENQEMLPEFSSQYFIATNDNKLEVKVRLDENGEPQFKNLLNLASSGDNPLTVDTEEIDKLQAPETPKREPKPIATPERKSPSKSSRSQSRKSRKSAGIKQNDQKSEINQNGIASISIPMSSLFTNCISVSNTLNEAVSSLDEVVVIITLDKPLLSDYQRHKLNPMVLTVHSASPMPQNGMSFEEMKTKCLPPYIKYTFHGCMEHKSEPKEHAKNIKFNDNNVILLGTMTKGHLFEYLRGPALKIEIHDRDPKECPKKKASIFGSRPDDQAICNVAYTGGHLHNALSFNNVDINYGVAEFDLSELLSGERYLSLIAPIRKYKASYEDGSHMPVQGNTMDIPAGEYLENGSEMKIRIELSRSLTESYQGNAQSSIVPKEATTTGTAEASSVPATIGSVDNLGWECPYSRIVYIFDYKNKGFLGKILTLATEINATALDLSAYPLHVIEAALSTYKLSEEQQVDKTLDIITGCQIIDGDFHIFILEGLSEGGIRKLWDTLEHPEPNDESFFRVLYNSDMTFAQRLYISLDVDLTRIRLHQPLCNIVKQPLLYVRDMIPKNCFNAVIKLFQLCQCTSLQTAIRNELLPSVPMIVSLGREFGVPLTRDDFHDAYVENLLAVPGIGQQESEFKATDIQLNRTDFQNVSTNSGRENKRNRQTLDMTNELYEKILAERKGGLVSSKNYINANIKSLLEFSKDRLNKTDKTVKDDTIEVAHNYSSQALNSTMLAYEKMREILSEDPDARYTYCPKYNSATVVPVSTDKELKKEQALSKQLWKTKEGFIFPGVVTSTEANQPRKDIHPARLEELSKPWRENILHANKLKPSVDRLLYKWADRDENFDLWKRPVDFFGQPAPVTIHAAGDALAKELLHSRNQDEQKWTEKVVVDDPRFQTHRCLVATELIEKGAQSSNQVDKIDGLLKDKPKKFSLKKQGMRLQPIPALSVVSYPNIERGKNRDNLPSDGRVNEMLAAESDYRDISGILAGLKKKDLGTGFHPGDHSGLSWSRDVNCIPIQDYEHKRFQELKGQDFRLVHTDRESIGKKIKPLTTEEKHTHVFFEAAN